MTQPPSEPIGGQSIHLATHLFRSERLTLARELRGLTKSALADRVSKTPSAISQFESGRVHPDVKSVAALALALGVEPRFFSVQPGSELL